MELERQRRFLRVFFYVLGMVFAGLRHQSEQKTG